MGKITWRGMLLMALVASVGFTTGCGPANTKVVKPAGGLSARTDNAATLSLPDSGYRIGPEDRLRISVWNSPELSLDLTVRPDGKISVPLIQDVQAAGLTPEELANVIHIKLLEYIKDPHVSVIVKEVVAPKYYILGAVNKPGTYPLRGDVSVLQAISIAGGFTPFASVKEIRLVRNNGGRQEVRLINYYKVIENQSRWNYLLKRGDTIVVPE